MAKRSSSKRSSSLNQIQNIYTRGQPWLAECAAVSRVTKVAGTAQRGVHAKRKMVLQAAPGSHRNCAVVPISKRAKFQNILAGSRGQPQRKASCHAQATATGHARPHRCALVPEQINGKDRTKSTRTQTTALTDVRAVVSRKDKARIASAGTAQRGVHAKRKMVLQAAPGSHRNCAVVPISKRAKFQNILAGSRGQPQRKASCHAQATATGHARPHRCALVPGQINGTDQTKIHTHTGDGSQGRPRCRVAQR